MSARQSSVSTNAQPGPSGNIRLLLLPREQTESANEGGKAATEPDVAATVRSDGAPTIPPPRPRDALARFEVGLVPPDSFAGRPAFVLEKFDFAQLALAVTVLEPVIVDQAREARVPAREWQGREELCECGLYEGVGEGERGKAGREEQRAKRDQ
jgi:hypothetical protein